MQSYRKRAKGSWNVGKGHKGEEGSERQFSRREIQQQIDADEETYLEKHKSRRRNNRARLEYRVKWYEDMMTRYADRMGRHWLSSGLERAKKDLQKLIEKESK